MNNDGDKDLIVGNTKGGLYYYENWDVFGIQQIGTEIPESFSLSQNYPNPFNPSTHFEFRIPARTGGADFGFVQLVIFDVLGREVSTLVNEELKPGIYKVDFDGTNYPSGVYYYRLETKSFSETRKMVLVK